jgi:polar amino acid transport system substrate-binding protein
MKKMIAMLLVLLLTLSCFAGCGAAPDNDSDLAYIQNKGKLVVGITDYAPMDYKDENGNWTGFDAEFAMLFAEELGVECEFYVIADWGKKFMELDTKQIDVVWNGMTITEEATANSSVSDPYVINAQVVVMKADAVGSYTDAASLSGLTIAVENGSAGQDAAEAIPGAKVVPLQDQGSALLEVKSGTADACVIDITMAYAMTGEGTNYTDLAPGISLTEEFYGISFRKNSDATAMLNEFMAKLKENGTLQALADKYNLTLTD